MSDQPNIDKIIKRIEALLNTSGRTEEEARIYAEKAQELLEAYNLDMAVLGKSATGSQGATRKDTNKKGGLYSWQRKLWKAVAVKGLAKGSTYEHRLIGSHANVIATQMMAEYLQQTIEKIAQEWAYANHFKSVFVRDAIAYREGMTTRIAERLQLRRDEQIAKARQEAEERKQAAAARGEAATGSALTIVDIISTEADFNNDYLNGWELGTTARQKHDQEMHTKAWRAEQAEKDRIHEERYATDPAYAADYDAKKAAQAKADQEWWGAYMKKASKRKPASTKVRTRAKTAEEQRAELDAFWEGRERGDSVGIDQQVDRAHRKAVR